MASHDISDEPKEFSFPVFVKLGCFVAMALGVVTFGLSWIGGAELAFTGYTIGAWYAVGLSLFAMFFMIISHLGGGGWHVTMKRVPEAMMQYFPVAFATFLMLILAAFATHFYEWAHPHDDGSLHSELLKHKQPWLNAPFFSVRMLVYFGIWTVFGFLMWKKSRKQDVDGDVKHTKSSRVMSAIFAPLFALSVTFASVDYIMSIEPTWFSTMFGVYQFSGFLLSGFAALILLLILLQRSGYLRKAVNTSHFHNLGMWLFAACTFWAYIWFCQFMLIWYSNIPEETQHFYARWEGPWFWVAMVVNPLLNWVIPFAILLPRPNKRSLKWLSIAAVVALLGRFVDIWQFVAPRPVHNDAHLPEASMGLWTFFTIGVTVGMVGLFVFITLKALEKAPLLAKKDPYFDESLHHHL
jgi:Ni/Fe-hydrogenase subunit HybB-like protein